MNEEILQFILWRALTFIGIILAFGLAYFTNKIKTK